MKAVKRFAAFFLAAALFSGCTSEPTKISTDGSDSGSPSVATEKVSKASSDVEASPETSECRMDFRRDGDGGHIGVWWWNAADGINEAKRFRYLDFLAQNSVDEIYFCPGNYSVEKIQTFVTDANARGMRVAWLTGDSGWLTEGGNGCETAVNRFLQYQSDSPLQARFYGIHMDVEPHQQSDFFGNRSQYMQRFIEIAAEAADSVHAAGYEIEWDLPFWFDDDRVIDRDGNNAMFLEAIASLSDTLCLMSYRDTANAILALSEQELAAAEGKDCRIVCGVETHSAEGDAVSFMEEGKAVMYRELQKLYTLLSEKEPYYGIAVHYLNTWYSLPD